MFIYSDNFVRYLLTSINRLLVIYVAVGLLRWPGKGLQNSAADEKHSSKASPPSENTHSSETYKTAQTYRRTQFRGLPASFAGPLQWPDKDKTKQTPATKTCSTRKTSFAIGRKTMFCFSLPYPLKIYRRCVNQ